MLRMMPFFNITNNELFEDLFKAECVKERLCQNSTFYEYNSLLSASNNDMLKQLKCAYGVKKILLFPETWTQKIGSVVGFFLLQWCF